MGGVGMLVRWDGQGRLPEARKGGKGAVSRGRMFHHPELVMKARTTGDRQVLRPCYRPGSVPHALQVSTCFMRTP